MSEWTKTGFEIYSIKQSYGPGNQQRVAEIKMANGVFDGCSFGLSTRGSYSMDDWAFLFLVAQKILDLSGRQCLGALLKDVAKQMEEEVIQVAKTPENVYHGTDMIPCDRVFEIIHKHLGV